METNNPPLKAGKVRSVLGRVRRWINSRSQRHKWILVVINPSAGQVNPDLKVLNKIIRETGFKYHVRLTEAFGDGGRLARQAVENGASLVAACGGDGTVMDVASGLIGSSVPLAILPSGTGNVLAKELGIPNDFVAACQLMVDETLLPKSIDLGMANDHPFLLRLGVGLEAEITRKADREAKDRSGVLAYITALAQAIGSAPISHYRMEIDGVVEEVDGLACMVANAGALGFPGLSIAPNVKIDDGKLDVIVLRRADLGELTSLAAKMIGVPPGPTSIPHWQCTTLTLTADPPQGVEADGEEMGETPVSISLIPHALLVKVPGGS